MKCGPKKYAKGGAVRKPLKFADGGLVPSSTPVGLVRNPGYDPNNPPKVFEAGPVINDLDPAVRKRMGLPPLGASDIARYRRMGINLPGPGRGASGTDMGPGRSQPGPMPPRSGDMSGRGGPRRPDPNKGPTGGDRDLYKNPQFPVGPDFFGKPPGFEAGGLVSPVTEKFRAAGSPSRAQPVSATRPGKSDSDMSGRRREPGRRDPPALGLVDVPMPKAFKKGGMVNAKKSKASAPKSGSSVRPRGASGRGVKACKVC